MTLPQKPLHPDHPTTQGASFTTNNQLAFRRGSGRRMLAAGMIALAGLIALVLLGPSQDEIKKRFEYYGAPGDLRVMPEIVILEGSDQVRQLPKTLQAPPPPAKIEVEPDNPLADTKKPIPHETLSDQIPVDERPTVDPVPDSEFAETNRVEMMLPRQSNPDWYILHQVFVEYPFTASAAEQRIPVIFVNVAIFVDPEGNVSEAMIQSSTGGSAFTKEVLAKIKLWKFGWRVDPKAGRWCELTFNFKSPYALIPNRNN